MRYIHHFW